ncbi:MAG: IS1182 family transposase [Actinomycetota bacterium]
MTLGLAERQTDLLDELTGFCRDAVPETSIYALLHRERDRLFPDEAFADLFEDVGRRSIPPSVVATVMVLQRLEGCSDREAVDRFTFDARWRYATGVGGWGEGLTGFVHTVLVDFRARLHRSGRPKRVFEVTLEVAREAGLVGGRRVLDSTPVYDAVATMDTVTLVRSAIRALLQKSGATLEPELRGALRRDDDYEAPGKPACDWEDPAAREALVDALARDALTLLRVLDGQNLLPEVTEAAELLATVVGQDLEEGEDERFRIARRVAPDRVISTVDLEARHGHKTNAKGFDGYKGHVAVDPDTEIVTATAVTPGNAGDATAAPDLLADVLPELSEESVEEAPAAATEDGDIEEDIEEEPVAVYGDSAYGTGEMLTRLERAGADPMVKVQAPNAPAGHFPKDRFTIDLEARAATCPGEVTVPLRPRKGGGAAAVFGRACRSCPLAPQCTTSPKGRVITIGPHEPELTRARERQRDPAWAEDYRATRPKVERKIGHLMRRRHGGRRARVRGQPKVDQDFSLLGAAVNLARLAVLGVRAGTGGWAVARAPT